MKAHLTREAIRQWSMLPDNGDSLSQRRRAAKVAVKLANVPPSSRQEAMEGILANWNRVAEEIRSEAARKEEERRAAQKAKEASEKLQRWVENAPKPTKAKAALAEAAAAGLGEPEDGGVELVRGRVLEYVWAKWAIGPCNFIYWKAGPDFPNGRWSNFGSHDSLQEALEEARTSGAEQAAERHKRLLKEAAANKAEAEREAWAVALLNDPTTSIEDLGKGGVRILKDGRLVATGQRAPIMQWVKDDPIKQIVRYADIMLHSIRPVRK